MSQILTVFTPVYNRARLMGRLYDCLRSQTDTRFEWIVVDDGSRDNIDDVMESFIKEGRMDIRYLKQPNGGKHRAFNRAVSMARGDFFFTVDSDDLLSPDAVRWINDNLESIREDVEFAALSGIKVFQDGRRVGGGSRFGTIDADFIDIRHKHGIKGDLAEVYRTSVLRQFPFPEFPGERFCSEGVVWNRIARVGYKIRLVHEPIYICEYMADGLSASNVQNRRNSPEGSLTLYAEQARDGRIPMVKRLKAGLLYWQFAEKSQLSLRRLAGGIPMGFLPLWPLGIALRHLSTQKTTGSLNKQ